MLNYRGLEVNINESLEFSVEDATSDSEYTVTNRNGLVFAASSQAGVSYAMDPESALSGTRRLIDLYLSK